MTQPANFDRVAERNTTAPAVGGGAPVFGRTVVRSNDANVIVVAGSVDNYVFMRGLTADRTVTLPAAPMTGQIVNVKDEDGSLAAHDIVVNGNGNLIDGLATYRMSAFALGAFGAVEAMWNGVNWGIV